MSSNGADKDLFDQLRALHADEFASLQKRLKGTMEEWDKSWWRRSLDIFVEYFKFIAETWFKCAWSLVFFPLSEFVHADTQLWRAHSLFRTYSSGRSAGNHNHVLRRLRHYNRTLVLVSVLLSPLRDLSGR